MKRTVLLAALVCLLAFGGQSFAELCTIDAVPAATLLLPYFEVGLNPADGADTTADYDADTNVDTLFSINNASAAPTIAHVSFWGDWSQPTIDFDVFLTGYDVATVSLADVFNNGNLPQTLHAWEDALDATSPHQGANSDNPEWDSFPDAADADTSGCAVQQDDPSAADYCPRFLSCDTPFAQLPLPVLTGDFLDLIRAGHTGQPLPGTDDSCVGQAGGAWGTATDYIARGYITIDNLNDCSINFPNTSGYFDNAGIGAATVKTQNQLWGDWYIIDEGRAIGDNLVAIEAYNDQQYPGEDFAAGDYTFYGRYVTALATDQREPSGSVWGARYLQPNAVFTGGTDLLVWRDAKCGRDAPWSCTDGPVWANLEETQVVDFSLSEDAIELCGSVGGSSGGGGVSPVPTGTNPDELQCFPIETGRYEVGGGNLNVQNEFGWLYLNLNHTILLPDATECDSASGYFGDIAQSYVTASVDNDTGDALFNVGFPAVQLASACDTGDAGSPIVTGDIGLTPDP